MNKISPILLSAAACAKAESVLNQIGWQGATLQVVIIFLLIILITITILAFIYLRKRSVQLEDSREVAEKLFEQACERLGITATEKSKLRQLLRHEPSAQPQVIFQSISVFEKCVAQEIRRIQSQRPSEALEKEENDLLSNIRRKAGFLHIPLEHPLASTRNISLGQTGSVFGQNHRIPIIQKAVVVEKNEFSFTLQYDSEKEDVFQILPGAGLKFAFTRQNDGLYGVQVNVLNAKSGEIQVAHTTDIRRNQLRQFVRIELSLPVRFRLLKTGDPEKSEIRRGEIVDAKMSDISGGGLSFLCESALKAGDLVSVSFALPNTPFNGIPCKILRVSLQEGKTKTFYKHHGQFVDLEQRKRDSIVKYVFEKQRQLNQWR
jgi:c-di-GMP-binding flagellar brake protein YcgR